tara:strand:+ start:5349 stop:6029 length:681 start_codon:yes stop_codon:yes gene_type:complete
MSTPRYDYSNPPNVHEGDDRLWTPEERDEWRAEYERRNYIPRGIEGRSKISHAVRKFEQKVWEFTYGGGWMAPEYIDWLRQVAFEVGGGCYELPEPSRTIRDPQTWRAWRDDVVARFVGDLHDEDNYEDDPCQSDEAKAALWTCALTPYRIWLVYDACREAGREAMEENLLAMSTDERGSESYVRKAARKAMEKACKVLWDEYEAPALAAKAAAAKAAEPFGVARP